MLDREVKVAAIKNDNVNCYQPFVAKTIISHHPRHGNCSRRSCPTLTANLLVDNFPTTFRLLVSAWMD